MFIKIEPNPTGGPDNAEARWWKGWCQRKKKLSEANAEEIERLRNQHHNLHIQQNATREELAILCAKYDALVKQLATEERLKNKSEHRRLEVEEEGTSI